MTGNRIIILGAMKCGTTALHDNLRRHPNIYEGIKKETHYYSMHYDKGRSWYEDHFPKVKDNEYTLESSPTYFSESSGILIPKLLNRDFPDGKFIVVIREPVSRSISHFNHLVKINKVTELINLDVNDFFNQDFASLHAPTTNLQWHLARVLKVSNYLWPMYNIRSIIPGKNLLVISNNDLLVRTEETMARIYKFLSVKNFYIHRFERFRYSHKSNKLNVSDTIAKKLQNYLYPSFRKFVEMENLNME